MFSRIKRPLKAESHPSDGPEESGASRVVVPFPRPGVGGASHERHAQITALFNAQYRRLVRFLTLRLGSVEEAREVAQDTYVRLLEREQATPDYNPQALMYVIARGFAIDRLRLRRRRRTDELTPAAHDTVSDTITPERILAGQQQLDMIEKLLRDLPPKCRHAFVRYTFQGYEYAQIAAELEVTESMVRKYVIRAVSYCASKLSTKGVEP